MFSDFINDRNKASATFQTAFGKRLSIESARKRFKEAVLRDLKSSTTLRGKAKNIHEVLKCTNATAEQTAEVVTIASSAAIGSYRGKELELICEEIGSDLEKKFPGLRAIRQADDETQKLFQKADLQLILPNGKILNFAIQINLWGGGAQAQRGSDYIKKCATDETFYCIISDPVPIKPLMSKNKNKTKSLFQPLLARCGMIYATEIEDVVETHLA